MLTLEMQRLADMVVALGGRRLDAHDDGNINFCLDDIDCFAYIKNGGARVRGTVILDVLQDEMEVSTWVKRQPQPKSGSLHYGEIQPGQYLLRILFERSVDDTRLDIDPLLEEAQLYADSWNARTDVPVDDGADATFTVPCDPRHLLPANAWLLLGDDASYRSRRDLLDDAINGAHGIFDNLWTTSKQTEVGDLLLFYFTAPRSAAHYVARAASRAFYDAEIGVNASRKVADQQWWCYTTPLIKIEPIAYTKLLEQAGGHFLLKGRSGVYLRPDFVDALPIVAKERSDKDALKIVRRRPVGNPELPQPPGITLNLWAALASGALHLESHVEQYVVEPLLQLALEHHRTSAWRKSHRVGRGVADYVVLNGDVPTSVVEVKLAVRPPVKGVWENSNDFQQVRRYADALGCRSALIDANRIYLIEKRAAHPHLVVDRTNANEEDIRTIGAFLQGGD